MSDNYIEDDVESNDIEASDGESPRGLRRAANKSKQLEQELNNMKRELAFTKAGINPDDPKMKYFVKGYDGEMSAEAVLQAALEAGFVSSQQGPSPALQQAAASQQRVIQASAGAVMEDASEEAAYARLEAAMAEGGVEAMMDVARQYGIPIASEQ